MICLDLLLEDLQTKLTSLYHLPSVFCSNLWVCEESAIFVHYLAKLGQNPTHILKYFRMSVLSCIVEMKRSHSSHCIPWWSYSYYTQLLLNYHLYLDMRIDINMKCWYSCSWRERERPMMKGKVIQPPSLPCASDGASMAEQMISSNFWESTNICHLKNL